MMIGGIALVRGFASANHVASMLDTSVFLGILAVGQTLVIVSGGIDLSLPYMVNLSAVLVAGLSLGTGARTPEALGVAVAAGVMVGLANGVGIGYFGVPPLVMTLAMNGVLEGVTLLYTGGTPFGSAPPFVARLGSGPAGPVTTGVWIWVGLTLIAVAVMGFTTFGRRVYAVGSAPQVARWSGVRGPRVLVGVYVICSVMGAVAGILLVGYAGQGYIGMGDQYLLPSVAVVVIGGASIYGGSGGPGSSLIGVLVIMVLTDLLVLLNIGQSWQDVAYGLVIIAMLLVRRGVVSERGG